MHGPIATNILNIYTFSVAAQALDVQVRRRALSLTIAVALERLIEVETAMDGMWVTTLSEIAQHAGNTGTNHVPTVDSKCPSYLALDPSCHGGKKLVFPPRRPD